MKSKLTLPLFEISPLAKAGIFVMNLNDLKDKGDHDVSTPHRDNHYLLLLIIKGNIKLNLDFEDLIILSPSIVFVLPGQVHHILEVNNIQGWVISFDPSLLENEFQLALERGISIPIKLSTETSFYRHSTTLIGLMEKLQPENGNSYISRSLQGLLGALLNIVMAYIKSTTGESTTKENRGTIIEQSFRLLLKEHFKSWKSPSQYAEALSITVSHLNDTLKERTGLSVSTLIQEYSILEAKRLLYFTNLSAKEIGYELGYDEPVYFGKLFKKVSGFTPLQFRKKVRS